MSLNKDGNDGRAQGSAEVRRGRAGVDLTQGSIPRGIAAFALPLLFTSVVQQLYSTVDLLFVSNFVGTEAAAALGISVLLVTCLVGLLTGVSVGVNVVVGQLFGAKELSQVDRAVHTALALGIVGGVVLAVVGLALAPAYVALMETPPEIVEPALQYLRVYFVAMIVVAAYNMEAGIARALGDSKSPLWAQTIGGLMNVAGNYLFICVFGWGIAGSATATLLSNAVAAAIVTWRLARMEAPYRLRARALCLDAHMAQRIVRVGVPMGAQSMVITLSNVILQHQIDLLGVSAIAAFTAYYKVELPIYYAIVALGQATTTFVAQNHGAGDHARMRRGARWCQTACLVVTVVLSAVMLAVGYGAFWIFNSDPEVIGYGLAIIHITFPLYFLYAVLEVQGAIMRGLGHSATPALIVLLNICILRTGLVLLFTAGGVTVEGVAWAYPISWATTAVCMVVARIVIEKRKGHMLARRTNGHASGCELRGRTHDCAEGEGRAS